MTNRRGIFALLIATLVSCGPPDVTPDCVPVDEHIGTSGILWCDGQPFPIDLEWQGQIPIETYAVCLPPEADGTCKLCPTSEVTDRVEIGMHELLDQYRPECQVEHWELGCMWTMENAMSAGYETNSCCFQVAVWGNDACGGG